MYKITCYYTIIHSTVCAVSNTEKHHTCWTTYSSHFLNAPHAIASCVCTYKSVQWPIANHVMVTIINHDYGIVNTKIQVEERFCMFTMKPTTAEQCG